tara:strand:- start:109 stop:357 length:249 start_codon:yes stop_codon:yes gene_type:complete
MVTVDFNPLFEKILGKIKNPILKKKVKNQIRKIVSNPLVGKPMMHGRKGTREVYIPPFRLSYVFFEQEDKIVFMHFYHKDEQ